MKAFRIFISLLAGFLLFGCEAPEQPNVVYILTDQWRASAMGYTGDPNVRTPYLDELAEESVNFVNAVSVCPVCTPYRASLMTGRFPVSTGMTFNDLYLPSEELCMAEIFRDAGYHTAYLGKWHLDGHGRHNNVDPDRRQGFEYWKGAECSHDYNHMLYYVNDLPEKKFWKGYSPFALSRDAIRYVDNHAGDKEPFLLFISIATPHFPHNSAPEAYKERYPAQEIQLPPNVPAEMAAEVLPELQGYYAHCTATDRAIGELVAHMDSLGMLENTILVFTSDHGEMMGGHGRKPFRKQLVWDESLHIPFLIRLPGTGKHRGASVNAPLTTPDILPSLLGLCHIEIPESIEGEDISELIREPDPESDRAVLVMHVTPFGINRDDPAFRALRTSRYTYAVSPEGPFLLTDHREDPFEEENLLDDPAYATLRADLHHQLMEKLKTVGDEELFPREYYIQKWGYTLDRDNINYWSFEEGKGRVQGPGMKRR